MDTQPHAAPGPHEAKPMEAALSVQVPPAESSAAIALRLRSPSDRLRMATRKVQNVNRVGHVIKDSHGRRRARGMSTARLNHPEDRSTGKKRALCCSAKPTETDSLVERGHAAESVDSTRLSEARQNNDALLEIAMQAGLTEVEGRVIMELFLQATGNEEWLNADALKEMMRWFTLQLDEHQLKNILKDIHVKHAAETMEELIERDDLINFTQFVWLINGYKSTAFTEAAFREAFKVLDPDGDGELTREEIQRGLDIVEYEVTDDDADAMLNYADRCASIISGEDLEMTGDGKVMQHEFVSFMGHPEFIDISKLGARSEDADARSIELWMHVRALILGIHSMHELWEKALLLYDEEYMEQWDSEKQNRYCFYNPSSPGRQAWDFAMLPFFVIIAIAVPYRIGFDIDVPIGSFGFWLDVLIDVYFAIDIIVNFRTAYYDGSGKLISDTRLIAKKYLKTWFVIDFVSCVPIGYIFMIVEAAEGGGGHDQGQSNQIKLTKILRLVRLAKNLARIARLKKLKTVMEEYEDYFEPIMTGLHLFKLFCALIFLGHVMACFWYSVGVNDEKLADGQMITGWVTKEGWGPEVDDSTRYLASYFYSLTDFVGELGQTNAERLYGLCSHLMYETFFGFLVGTFATIVMSGRVSDQKKAEKLQGVREFTHQQKLPMKGRKKIRSFYEILYKYNTVFNEGELLEDLPESVRRSLTSTIHKNFTAQVTFFRGFQEEVTVPLFLALRHVRLDEDEIVVKEGELSREIYIVLDGSAEVYVKWTLPDRTRVGTVSKGAIFGEIELLAHIDNPELIPIRRRTVKVAHMMNAGFIRYDRLQEIMNQHPSVLDRIRSFSKKRQRSEREKLAATKSSVLGSEKADTKLYGIPSSSVVVPEIGVDLNKGLHQGMSEWDWRRRVDARLDKLTDELSQVSSQLTRVLTQNSGSAQSDAREEGKQQNADISAGSKDNSAATARQVQQALGATPSPSHSQPEMSWKKLTRRTIAVNTSTRRVHDL